MDPLEQAAQQRVMQAGGGQDQSTWSKLLDAIAQWWHGKNSDQDPEGADMRRKAVGEALLRSLPQSKEVGPGATLDAVAARRRMYDDALNVR